MFQIKKVKLTKPLPFIKLLPNLLTLLGLCIGLSSFRFALDSKWEMAVTCIVIAAIIDGLDGRVARLLGATSHFGAELDSLCDFVNFGVAPALITYLWSFQQFEFKVISWAAVMLFAVCMSIRLARFNTNITTDDTSKASKRFFTGVPAPSGAMLLLMPIMLDFDLSTAAHINIRSHTLALSFYQMFVALLLASRLPTFSFKDIVIKPEYVWIALLSNGVFIISIMLYPWYILPACCALYLTTIPLSILVAQKIN